MDSFELLTLLKNHQITHPIEFEKLELTSNSVEIDYMGDSWWTKDQSGDRGGLKSIKLKFAGVYAGSIDCEDFERAGWSEDLEHLAVVEHSDMDVVAITCNSPIIDPVQILRGYLDAQSQNPAIPDFGDLFNCGAGGSVADFEQLVAKSPFLLFRGPAHLAKGVLQELARQNVEYLINVQEEVGRMLEVQLNNSVFYCERAIAEFR